MEDKQKSWKVLHDRMNLIYHAVIAVSLLPFCWVLLEMEAGRGGVEMFESGVKYLAITCLGLVIFAVAFIAVKRNRKCLIGIVAMTEETHVRLKAYSNSQVQYYLLLGLAAVVSALGMWLTGSYLFVFGYLGVLFIYSLQRPSLDKLIREVRLNKEERKVLLEEEGGNKNEKPS